MKCKDPASCRQEARFHRSLLRSIDAPYKFGGRGWAGIDCSSLLLKAVRDSTRIPVARLPWMTADQLAKGHLDVTLDARTTPNSGRCVLAFFDWDEDSLFEHAAARLLDGTWVWASTTAGKVIRVDPRITTRWKRQWHEIAQALEGRLSVMRIVNWDALRHLT